jgi:hypothetical protein
MRAVLFRTATHQASAAHSIASETVVKVRVENAFIPTWLRIWSEAILPRPRCGTTTAVKVRGCVVFGQGCAGTRISTLRHRKHPRTSSERSSSPSSAHSPTRSFHPPELPPTLNCSIPIDLSGPPHLKQTFGSVAIDHSSPHQAGSVLACMLHSRFQDAGQCQGYGCIAIRNLCRCAVAAWNVLLPFLATPTLSASSRR